MTVSVTANGNGNRGDYNDSDTRVDQMLIYSFTISISSCGSFPWKRFWAMHFCFVPYNKVLSSQACSSSTGKYYWLSAGPIIGDEDRKRAPFLVLGWAPWYGIWFLFIGTNCAIACGTRAHAAMIFADVAQGKWRPRFPKSFMLLAHNSTRLCLLEFGLSILVESSPVWVK